MADCQQPPFLSPYLPFYGPLFGGLREGKTIIIIGRVLPNADRFDVDLLCGSSNGADSALHFNPRFGDGSACIVYNTFEGGSYCQEVRSDSPFVKGQPFTLEIHVSKEAFKISVNGKHVTDFKHRFPFTRVDTIRVLQMVALDFIAYQKPVVKISCNKDQFNVFVNDQQTHTYKHRFTKLEDIDVFEVCGGLLLFSVEV